MLPSFSIGPVRVDPGLVLAPMSGITDSALRRAVRARSAGALGLVVTEFVSVEGMTRGNRRSLTSLRYGPEERPISAQLFGADVDRMVRGAEIAQSLDFDVVDVNAGCPAPKVVRRGGGAELMRRPEHLERLLRAVVRAVDVPVTLKTRAGWDASSVNAVEIAELAEAAGVRAVTVHGRTRRAGYSGEADWDLVQAVAERVRIPVVGSGDLRTPEDARRRLAGGKVAGLMIGRAVLANPWVFSDVRDGLLGRPVPRRPLDDRIAFLRDYASTAGEILPPRAVTGRVKGLATRLTRGLAGGAALRAAVYATGSVEAVLAVLTAHEQERCCSRSEEQAA